MKVGAEQSFDTEVIPSSTRPVSAAVGWSFVMTSTRLVSTLGTAFLLASLLGPRAFGTVALALIFVTLVQLLVQQGIGPALVQRPVLTWRHLDSAFWLSAALAIVLAAVGVLVAPTWASINGTPEARNAIWALTSLIVIKGLVVVHEGYLQRALRFRELAIRTTVASAIGAVVGIVWAVVHPSIWALVAQQIVSAVVGAVVVWSVVDWRPRLVCKLDDVRDLFGFAVKSTVSSFGVFVNSRVDVVLIGLYFGATAIGLYQLAFRLMRSAVETMVYPIAGVALADLSRQHDPAARAERYLLMVGVATVVGTPPMAAVFAAARPLMATIGPEWAAAAPALQILCVVGVATIVGMINSPALQAAGRPGSQASLVWFGAAVSALTFVVAGLILRDGSIREQVVGMAASRAVVYLVVLLPLTQMLIAKHVGVGPIEFLRVIVRPLAASGAAAGIGVLTARVLERAGAASALATVVVGSVTMVVALVLLFLWAPHFRVVLNRIVDRLPSQRTPNFVLRLRTASTPAES